MAEGGELVIEAVADPGAGDHIVSPANISGIEVVPPRASRGGGGYVTASGGRIGNECQCALKLQRTNGDNAASSVFQVAQVTRSPVSIGRTCGNGSTVLFTKEEGVVRSNGGKGHLHV